MSSRERFFIGGIGGLAPVLMFLIAGDFNRFFASGALIATLGYCVRAAILFFIGGFVVCLYREEKERMKIFQLGLGAPAMLAGFLATNTAIAPVIHEHSNIAAITVVYAQTTVSDQSELKRFTLPASSPAGQFFEGLTGMAPQNVWFVITGSFLSLDSARGEAKRINDRFPDFHADVYAPYQDNPNYAVVIGANLTQSQARGLRNKAVAAGLPRDTYYKTFPSLPLP